ncbi:MAG: phosphoribosylformylglycinamidine synthase [Selenomonadaceae bacterium]|nr:phosphoribosylformylglycinamidine synthase [Selenomonadaceae bacterium]
MVKRIYVEKRDGFDVPAKQLLEDYRETLNVKNLAGVRLLVRYDVEDLSDEDFIKVRDIVFREPNVDNFYNELPADLDATKTFAVEYLPGQFDQRADSAAQCVQLVTGKELPTIHSARIISLIGDVTAEDFAKIKSYSINAIESREASFELPTTLKISAETPPDVEVLKNFNGMSDAELKEFLNLRGLAMNLDDLKFCQSYFRDTEKRAPTITELKVIDTYWSDHCRHTTFTTAIDNVTFDAGAEVIEQAFKEYLAVHNPDKDISLMDLGTIGAKIVKPQGLDTSEEINACSIKITAQIDGRAEDWLVMFKNETHNHPTEIEPFGGAATCLGGAIRDPLSGRSYVYQAMRVTGAADPRKKFSETLSGKLPQKKIVRGAAQGYSSYGNQIGLATGQVKEIYHEGYLAKRMEIGAVIAAAPSSNVIRKRPCAGDKVILLGGRTGRDGIGGATGSSKVHTTESLTTAGAEVQKGNPPTERKIQRLFRNPDAAKLIKRCNDFGAGGVAVAVGELAAGLKINLDAVRKKYDGLDGTELAISESQERMAVVLDKNDVEKCIALADAENLEAYEVAEVTDSERMVMNWRGKEIVNISRKFFDTNGVKRHIRCQVSGLSGQWKVVSGQKTLKAESLKLKASNWLESLRGLNICSQKGLVERFDSTIGASTVLMPFGGKNQLTPAEGMVAKIPCEGETSTATAMTFGFDADISEQSPFHGAIDAVTSSLAKLTAIGADYSKAYLTFQEYFEKLGDNPEKWGKPLAALLGAFIAQKNFGVAAIGGKDSMSGTFENLNVPPTLVSFAVAVVDAEKVISPEFKAPNHKIYLVECPRDDDGVPNFDELKKNFAKVHELICAGKIISAATLQAGGIAEAISKMSIGNDIGFKSLVPSPQFLVPSYGSLVVEANCELDFKLLGETIAEPVIKIGDDKILLDDVKKALSEPLEKIFPTKIKNQSANIIPNELYQTNKRFSAQIKLAKPKIFIPVFPGTNCEYDSAKVWQKAGGIPEIFIVRNLTPQAVEESIEAMAEKIRSAQIIMLPGGFSGGDEPDGSGKFIAATFRNPKIAEEVMNLLNKRDGLILGICNGFQALIKLGLLPYGEIRELEEDSPTLTHNSLGRHVSQYVYTRVASNLSVWLAKNNVGDVHSIPVSHGEGRFVASDAWLKKLAENGQIATQYVDFADNPTNELPFNPNGSAWAIEGITDASGRIFGKMGHSERIGEHVCKNIHGNKDQKLFEAGVEYFS